MVTLEINGKIQKISATADTPLLWVLREELGLSGTKFSCGEGLCGACTVLIDDEPARSCITPVEDVVGKKVVTIEGLAEDHPVKQAWLTKEVSQCGYCQPGQIMTAAAFLQKNEQPTDADIDASMAGNLCRCGTYPRIRLAIKEAATKSAGGDE